MQNVKMLDETNLNKLQALGEKLGCCVIALEPQSRLARMSESQLKKLQALEKEIDVVLLAYNC